MEPAANAGSNPSIMSIDDLRRWGLIRLRGPRPQSPPPTSNSHPHPPPPTFMTVVVLGPINILGPINVLGPIFVLPPARDPGSVPASASTDATSESIPTDVTSEGVPTYANPEDLGPLPIIPNSLPRDITSSIDTPPRAACPVTTSLASRARSPTPAPIRQTNKMRDHLNQYAGSYMNIIIMVINTCVVFFRHRGLVGVSGPTWESRVFESVSLLGATFLSIRYDQRLLTLPVRLAFGGACVLSSVVFSVMITKFTRVPTSGNIIISAITAPLLILSVNDIDSVNQTWKDIFDQYGSMIIPAAVTFLCYKFELVEDIGLVLPSFGLLVAFGFVIGAYTNLTYVDIRVKAKINREKDDKETRGRADPHRLSWVDGSRWKPKLDGSEVLV